MQAHLVEHPRPAVLTAQDLLAGGGVTHDVTVPAAVLSPGRGAASAGGQVRLRPLSVGTLTLISRAAREDSGLIPLLMIREAVVEPALSLEQVRQMHIGLVHFLVGQINLISGLTLDGQTIEDSAGSALGRTHLLLAKHFGWTPEQVSQLTPAQVAVYLSGIERLMAFDEKERAGE